MIFKDGQLIKGYYCQVSKEDHTKSLRSAIFGTGWAIWNINYVAAIFQQCLL